MAFSGLFGKRKGKAPDERAGGSDAARDQARADGGADTMGSRRGPNTKSPPVLSPRDVARQTARKIDLIESQIESEILASRTDAFVPQRSAVQRATGDEAPSIGQSTDVLLGDSHLAHSMVIADSIDPVLEEAAILYANGQDLPAVAVLSAAVREARMPDTWLMLLELYQSLGKQTEFEQLAVDYAVEFETSAPGWVDTGSRRRAPVPKPAPAQRAAIVFQGVLDARIVPQLEQLKALAHRTPALHLEFEKVTRVDPVGADLMLRVLAAFTKSKHEVTIRGADVLAERLREGVAVNRRDEPNTVWMLLLEMYRILGDQAAFEEASIDFCVTYEVSPPSWEPAAPTLHVEEASTPFVAGTRGGAASAHDDAAVPDEALGPDTIALAGEVLGKAEADLDRLNAFANTHQRITVDCSRLARVDFTAAGLLLNWAVGMRGAKKQVEFVQVGYLVGALFTVMGVPEVAPVGRRRV